MDNDKNKDMGLTSINPIWSGPPEGKMQADSMGSILWDFDKLKIPKLWTNYGVFGQGVNVSLIDSGIQTSHHLFAHSQVKALSFMHNDSSPEDGNGHGTWCCGKIGANGVGIAPKCRMHSLRTLDDGGSGYNFWTTNALKWVNQQPDPHIVNMSLGSFSSSTEQATICKELYDKGCIIVAAAGNENTIQKSYPAAYDGVLAVAATDSSENRAWFSNYGEHVALSAPGVSCYSTYPHNNFRKLQGTSMASPTVAGLLTLGMSYLLKKNPSIARSTMRDIIISSIQNTAIDLGSAGKDYYYGYGGIHGENFMAAVAKSMG
jgi:subtilisin family serine protease